MTERGLLIVLSGPSGVGKDTILQRLLETRDDCVLSVSATTRAPREGEVDGRDYFFLTRERFGELVACGDMLEYAQYSGNCYGTPAGPVEDQRQAGKHVILEIEVQGAMQVKEKCPGATFVFVMPPSLEVLRQRLENRGTETPVSLEKRMAAARSEMDLAKEYDYIIVNHSVEESCAQLDAVLTAACLSTKQLRQDLEKECPHA